MTIIALGAINRSHFAPNQSNQGSKHVENKCILLLYPSLVYFLIDQVIGECSSQREGCVHHSAAK
jgi:hypothetical protein